MSRFLSPKYQSLEEYVPGEQPRDQKYIKLNTNESPYPPSPGVLAVINAQQAADLRLYSDPTCRALREKMARLYGVEMENIYLANGSDDILNFAFMAFGDQGAAYPAISYGFYRVFAELYGIIPEEIPLEADLSIDPRRYWNRGKLVVIANPNAPTGLLLSLEEIEGIVANNPDQVVVVDEAYIDFGGQTALPLIGKYENLLVVRTFSKSRSMAGARLGYAFGSRGLIADLEKLKYATNPYNLGRLPQAAGAAAMEEEDYYQRNCERIMQTRGFTKAGLERLGFAVTDSKANFLFAKSSAISGQELYAQLKKRGILVRHFSRPEIEDYNRITIGSREEMEVFLKTTAEILEAAT